MARIRIVDEWIRSPASSPTYARVVMVVAEKWAEQRVLMRAYAESRDQTRPVIVLHGLELAIGPAGIDVHAPWGIHAPGGDGQAQELCGQLELAARRLAGSKGNAPRLADEESTFERKPTNNWAPGTPRDPSAPRSARQTAGMGRSAPANPAPPDPFVQQATRVPAAQAATLVPSVHAAEVVRPSAVPSPLPVMSSAPAGPVGSTTGSLRRTPVPRVGGRTRGPTQAGKRTSLGYQSGAGAQSALVRLGLRPAVSARLARLAERTVSVDFQVGRSEREVLNRLGEGRVMSAREIGGLIGIADAVGWMEQLISKLEKHGLDLIEPGQARDGDPTYVLRA